MCSSKRAAQKTSRLILLLHKTFITSYAYKKMSQRFEKKTLAKDVIYDVLLAPLFYHTAYIFSILLIILFIKEEQHYR